MLIILAVPWLQISCGSLEISTAGAAGATNFHTAVNKGDSELWDHSSAGTSSSGSGESEDTTRPSDGLAYFHSGADFFQVLQLAKHGSPRRGRAEKRRRAIVPNRSSKNSSRTVSERNRIDSL